MANPTSAEPAPKVVKIKRFQIGVNVLIQLCIVAGIVLMLNYLSYRHFKRWDFSRSQKFALSSQTTNLLGNLKKPVKAVIFFANATQTTAGAQIAADVHALLREYEFASDRKVNTEVVDPYRNFTRAQDLQTKYKFGANENIVILDYDGRSKFVNAADLAEIEMPDQMSLMAGQTEPRLKAFKGEQAITTALLELTEGKPNKIYYLTGHGEPDLNGEELKIFSESLKRQNIQAAPLNLLNVSAIPEDARGLVICGPKYDLSELEMKLLGDFWENKGRVLVLLNPFARTPRLATWLGQQGILPQEDRILRTGTFLQTNAGGKPQLVSGVINNPAFVVLNSHTGITKDLAGLSKAFLGATESIQLDQDRARLDKLKLIPLLQSGEGFWGETDLANGDGSAVDFDPKKDHMGPLTLAAAVEKGGLEDERVKMETSRLVVFGNSEFLNNNTYRLTESVSSDLAMNTINWLLDRKELIGIAPKEKKNVTLSLDEKQLETIALGVMGIIPGIVALFGLLSWWQRRA